MKKKKLKRWIIAALCMSVVGGINNTSHSMNADYFKTEEYYASTGLPLLHAADAYALGYTGKGILLGICDEYVKLTHPEFMSKLNSATIQLVPEDYDWIQHMHGTHVGGIMAAAKDDIGMHGLAFDADLLSGEFIPEDNLINTYEGLKQNSRVKIINNSWGNEFYIDEIRAGKQGVFNAMQQADDNSLGVLTDSIVHYDKVLVFAACNSGHPSASAHSLLPYLEPQTAGNFINVISVDSGKYNLEMQTAASNFLSPFSDLVKYVEENSIAAPGFLVNSAYAGNDSYVWMAGTSMAAPYVTAAAGLVQQAFPYMNGKQIVDTVLSTANSAFALPKYTMTIQVDYPDPTKPRIGTARQTVNCYYFGSKPDDATIKQDLTTYYYENQDRLNLLYGDITIEKFLAAPIRMYDTVPYEMIFGQGLLDAGAAVRGPGLLNARRLDKNSFSPASEYGQNQALYSVDTKGYDSVWSHTIGEKRAGLLAADSAYEDLRKIYNYYRQGDALYSFQQGQNYIDEYNAKVEANGLKNLPVGLLKRGEGILALTGNNTYQGSSVAAGGVLQIDGSVAGDAYSIETGTIAGTGSIKKNLINRSIVSAGSYNNPGTLTVDGDFASNGKIAVTVKNNENSRLSIFGSASINGTTLVPVTGSIYRPDTSYNFLTAGSIAGNFLSAPFTGMLSASGSHDGTAAQLVLTRQNNLETPSTTQRKTYQQMEAMYDRLAGQTAQREMDPLYSLFAAEAKQGLTEIYGGAQLNQANSIQRSRLVGSAVSARLSYLSTIGDGKSSLEPTSAAASDFADKNIIPLDVAGNPGWWMKLTRNWGELEADNDQPSFHHQSFGAVLGKDRNADDNWRTGFFFAYEKNDGNSTVAKAKTDDYRLGLYGGYTKAALDVYTYMDYGQQDNRTTRTLQHLGLQAGSHYDSNTLEGGIEAKYTLPTEKESAWQISPYAGVHLIRYKQNSYTEQGAGIYSQQADKLQNTYSTGECGVEFAKKLPQGQQYTLNIGYKKVLGGNEPEMTVAYSGNPGEKFKQSGNEQDKEYLVWGLHVQSELAKDWTINSQIENEIGRHSKNVNASVMLCRSW